MTPALSNTPNSSWNDVVAAAHSAPDELVYRHIGLPPGNFGDPRWSSQMAAARTWFQRHGTPWANAATAEIERVEGESIQLAAGRRLTSGILARGFAAVGVERIIVFGASAGPEVEARISELWQIDRPDEAMFLNALAVAVVEHLRSAALARIGELAQCEGARALPHYSPGYEGWSLADQRVLYQVLADGARERPPISVLASGGLSPAKSTLAAVGLAANGDGGVGRDFWRDQHAEMCQKTSSPQSGYAFAEKTLALWRRKRLQLRSTADGGVTATFRFDGSTCTNMGLPLAFVYSVDLCRELNGRYRIVRTDCQPLADRPGYQSMCAYLDNPEQFIAQLNEHRPLVGCLLDEALRWDVPASAAGCLCTQASRDHRWRTVFHALHYALHCHD